MKKAAPLNQISQICYNHEKIEETQATRVVLYAESHHLADM